MKSLDERFYCNIESIGPNFISNIRAFYRPIQVNQKKISEIKKDLKKNEFKILELWSLEHQEDRRVY